MTKITYRKMTQEEIKAFLLRMPNHSEIVEYARTLLKSLEAEKKNSKPC